MSLRCEISAKLIGIDADVMNRLIWLPVTAAIEINQVCKMHRNNIISWACKGFDRDHAAGEASRTGCVKFQT